MFLVLQASTTSMIFTIQWEQPSVIMILEICIDILSANAGYLRGCFQIHCGDSNKKILPTVVENVTWGVSMRSSESRIAGRKSEV